MTVPNSDDSSLPSVNPSPIVSSLSSPQVSSESFVQTSTPVLSTPQDQIATPQASCSIPQEQSTTPSSRAAVENPLVRAGLVPQHLADIFMTVHADEANDKRTSRRITGVRVLTSNDYVEIMKEKDRKVKEAAELKQKRKEERELKKIKKEKEREQKKKELEEKRRNKKERGKGKKRQRHSSSESGDQSVTGSENEDVNNHNRPSRRRCIRVPNRYHDENADSEASDTECVICNARESLISEGIVFWVDYDSCGEWAHTYCAFGSNTASRRFVCSSCST